jgi:HSP20 family protein
MAELSRWDPFRDPVSMLETMNRLFDDRSVFRRRENESLSHWSPLVDIFEDTEGVTLVVELPGVEPKGVDLKVEDGVLTVSGERKLEHEDKRQNYQKIERWYGTFLRSFTLPPTVDVEHIRAEHKHGLLRVFLPRKEEMKPKRITVKVE